MPLLTNLVDDEWQPEAVEGLAMDRRTEKTNSW